MEPAAPEYLTRIFQEAADFPLHKQLEFLSRLPDIPFYRPDSNNKTFRDTAVFCLSVSGMESKSFAAELNVPYSLLEQWLQERHLPYPIPRAAHAKTMIETALHANGWIGTPPVPPVLDGSNVFPMRPRSP